MIISSSLRRSVATKWSFQPYSNQFYLDESITHTFQRRPVAKLIRSLVHTEQAAVFAQMCTKSTKTSEEINLKGKINFNDTNIYKSYP